MRYFSATALTLLLAAPAHGAEFIVNSSAELSSALSSASSGDTITITPLGSPYVGSFTIPSVDLTIRGSEPDPAAVVIQSSGGNAMRYDSVSSLQLNVESLTFTGTAAGAGRGFLIVDFGNGSFRFENCVFSDVEEGLRFDSFNSGQMTVLDSTFENCSEYGVLTTGTSTYRRCLFTQNNTTSSALTQARNRATVEDCVFTDNTSAGDGGAIFADDGFDSLRRNVFLRNTAQRGGAVATVISSPMPITDNLFVDNAAQIEGGAIALGDAPGQIERNTFVDNVAPVGSAVHNTSGDTSVWNCIFWNVDAPVGSPGVGPFLSAGITRGDWVLLQGGGNGPRQYDFDPLFVDPSSDNYRLQAGSPALDGGCVFGGITPLETSSAVELNTEYTVDLDGNDRRVDTDNAAGGCQDLDLGCYEFQPGPTCVADVTTTNTNPGQAGYGTPDGAVDGADLSYYVELWLSGCF